jgi:hypothetical protein
MHVNVSMLQNKLASLQRTWTARARRMDMILLYVAFPLIGCRYPGVAWQQLMTDQVLIDSVPPFVVPKPFYSNTSGRRA